MLKLPGQLSPRQFLSTHWQKKPLFMPQANAVLRPSISRNELAWLSTMDDVESRIVFIERGNNGTRYRAESGPFDSSFLQALPKRDWTLLVHDVEKHLPPLRKLFSLVPFIPDWRIDDLMISFAAPGGGVGPHVDHYDVFLCQGIGERDWRYSTTPVAANEAASDTLQLAEEFSGDAQFSTRQGDVLYLPPGVAHWGVATKASMTYSIGMRAPDSYADPDLLQDEAIPGYISPAAKRRAGAGAGSLGALVTETKAWLTPEVPADGEIDGLLRRPFRTLRLHGMTRLAFDDGHIYVNGHSTGLPAEDRESIAQLCRLRRLDRVQQGSLSTGTRQWLLRHGAFELPEVRPGFT
jgi:hypothetical protein